MVGYQQNSGGHELFVIWLTQESSAIPRVGGKQTMATSPAELGTESDCAGEDQQKFTQPVIRIHNLSRGGMTSNTLTIPCVKEEAPFQNM
jgi:hypothetical protein